MGAMTITRGLVAVDISSTDQEFTESTLFIETGGDLKVDFANGQTGVTVNVPDHYDMPRLVKKVYKTGTTATGIWRDDDGITL